MRASFVVSEMVLGLRRNLTMTIAMVITTAISLGLFGAGLLIRDVVNDMKDYYYFKVEVSMFLSENVTPEQRDRLRTQLGQLPEVRSVLYESKAEAFTRFQEQFKNSPDLVKNVREDALPESFRVKLRDPEKFSVVAERFEGQPGVDQVQDQRRILGKLFSVLNGFQRAALIIAGVQAVAALLLISNTVQVAAFSRRRETGIMRLVGASRWYVQLPFILEAAFAGVLGAGLAVAGLAAAKAFVLDRYLGSLFDSGIIPAITMSQVLSTAPLLVAVSIVLASLAAVVTLHRYVRI